MNWKKTVLHEDHSIKLSFDEMQDKLTDVCLVCDDRLKFTPKQKSEIQTMNNFDLSSVGSVCNAMEKIQ